MRDQATILRELMQRRRSTPPAEPEPPTGSQTRTIAVTSGKGGVGKTNVALNLAIALAQMDTRVCLLDAGPGLGNIDLLCRLNGYWNLSHVIAGARTVKEIVLDGPAGVTVVPGAGDLADVANCPPPVQREIFAQLGELEQAHDVLVIDTASGSHRTARGFLTAADVVLLLTTPEPTAIADAYTTIKSLAAEDVCDLEVIVNRVESPRQAHAIIERLQQTARLFLHADVASAGYIPCDPHVARSVATRRPFLLDDPHCPASDAVKQLAHRVKNSLAARRTSETFFSRFSQRFVSTADPQTTARDADASPQLQHS